MRLFCTFLLAASASLSMASILDGWSVDGIVPGRQYYNGINTVGLKTATGTPGFMLMSFTPTQVPFAGGSGEARAVFHGTVSNYPAGVIYAVGYDSANNYGIWNPATGVFTSYGPAISLENFGVNENGWTSSVDNRYRRWDGVTYGPVTELASLSGNYACGRSGTRAALLNGTTGAVTTFTDLTFSRAGANQGAFVHGTGGSTTIADRPCQWGPGGSFYNNNNVSGSTSYSATAYNGVLLGGLGFGGGGRRALIWDAISGVGSSVLHDLLGTTSETFLREIVITETATYVYGSRGLADGVAWRRPHFHEPMNLISPDIYFDSSQGFVNGGLPQQGWTTFGGAAPWVVDVAPSAYVDGVLSWTPPTVTANTSYFAYKPISFTPTTTTPVYVASTRVYCRSKGQVVGSHNRGGLSLYSGATELARAMISGDGSITLDTNATTEVTSIAGASPDTFHHMDLKLDFSINRATVRIDGIDIASATFTPTTTPGVTDADLTTMAVPGGKEQFYFTQYKVGSYWQTYKISGRVNLQGHAPDYCTIHVYSGATLAFSTNVFVAADGYFETAVAVGPGTYKFGFKHQGWLTKSLVSTLSGDRYLGSVYLNGGDIVPDDVIDIADYTKLATFFDATSSDANWYTTDAYKCDLNSDGVVDIADYTILATNFDMVGDPLP